MPYNMNIMKNRIIPFILLLVILTSNSLAQIPFKEQLDQANISVYSMNTYIEEYGLLIGNGDLNGIVYEDAGNLAIRLTKNDIWDARLPVEEDNSLPTIKRLKEMVEEEGWPPPHPKSGWWNQRILPKGEPTKPYSYDLYPYPCPVSCGQIRIGEKPLKSHWKNIRELGTSHSAWETHGEVTIMSLSGSKEASNGFASKELQFNTDQYPQIKVNLRGTPNARYFIQLFQNGNQSVYSSLWIDAPQKKSENTLTLPSGKMIDTVYLYAMTMDGKRAQVEYTSVEFCSADGNKKLEMDLYAPKSETSGESIHGKLFLKDAKVIASNGKLAAPVTIRALANQNVGSS